MADLGFPLVEDQFHRDVHPLIWRHVLSFIHTGDLSLVPSSCFGGLSAIITAKYAIRERGWTPDHL
jgi:hypothetical protein